MLSNGAYRINLIVLYWSGSCIKMIIITYMLFYYSKIVILYIYLLSYTHSTLMYCAYTQQSSIFFIVICITKNN